MKEIWRLFHGLKDAEYDRVNDIWVSKTGYPPGFENYTPIAHHSDVSDASLRHVDDPLYVKPAYDAVVVDPLHQGDSNELYAWLCSLQAGDNLLVRDKQAVLDTRSGMSFFVRYADDATEHFILRRAMEHFKPVEK